MVKKKGKKFKNKGPNIRQPNAKIKKKRVPELEIENAVIPAPAPLTEPAQASASNPVNDGNGTASQNKEKDKEKKKRLYGFIFMCNKNTKSECFQYRVFGLPMGKKELVEGIQPGTKLFLFDFDLKILYGVYEATSAGKVNLEPAAFKGKFPAQVKFKIFKECLPMHESSLKHAIKENYQGLKFKQELSGKQVRNLLSSLRPLTAPSLQLAPPTLQNVAISRALPPSAMEDQYLAGMQYYRGPPVMERQPVPQVHISHHGYHGTAAYVERVHPAIEHPGLPPNNSYYVTESLQPHFTEGIAYGVQEPYSRYRTDQVTGLDSDYRRLPIQREVLRQDGMVAYSSYPAPAAPYASSVVRTQAPASGYSAHPAPAAPYASSVVQTQAPASGYIAYPTPAAPYASSGVQPHAPSSQGSVPISSYYSLGGPTRIYR